MLYVLTSHVPRCCDACVGSGGLRDKAQTGNEGGWVSDGKRVGYLADGGCVGYVVLSANVWEEVQ